MPNEFVSAFMESTIAVVEVGKVRDAKIITNVNIQPTVIIQVAHLWVQAKSDVGLDPGFALISMKVPLPSLRYRRSLPFFAMVSGAD